MNILFFSKNRVWIVLKIIKVIRNLFRVVLSSFREVFPEDSGNDRIESPLDIDQSITRTERKLRLVYIFSISEGIQSFEGCSRTTKSWSKFKYIL